MDELHLRLIRLGLEALGDDFGFALASGYAVQAHHIVQRLSDDVDLFAPIERRGEMPAATERIVAVLATTDTPWRSFSRRKPMCGSWSRIR